MYNMRRITFIMITVIVLVAILATVAIMMNPSTIRHKRDEASNDGDILLVCDSIEQYEDELILSNPMKIDRNRLDQLMHGGFLDGKMIISSSDREYSLKIKSYIPISIDDEYNQSSQKLITAMTPPIPVNSNYIKVSKVVRNRLKIIPYGDFSILGFKYSQ